MKKKVIIYGVIVIAIISGLFLFRNGNRENGINVRTALATSGELKSYLSTTGTVKSQNSKEYYGFQGKVLEVRVKVGDQVEAGDLLVRYETQDLESTVRQAQIQYDNAVLQRNELENQNKSISDKIGELNETIRDLEEEGADKSVIKQLEQQRDALTPISSERLKQAENSVTLAKISLDSAKDKLSQNQSTLKAEVSGVVTSVNVVEGAMGNVSQPAVVVQDIENLKAIVALGKYDADKIELGQEALIKGGGAVYTGVVAFIDPVAKKSVGAAGGETSLEIQINILEKAPKLRVEFDVDLDILIGESNNVVKVPLESVKIEKGNKNIVYVVEDNVAKERTVTTGLQTATEIEILTGIKAGEKVILNPSTQIKDGITVVE